MVLNIYSSVEKGLKLNFRKNLRANSNVWKSYSGKTCRVYFLPPSPPILNRVNIWKLINNWYLKSVTKKAKLHIKN